MQIVLPTIPAFLHSNFPLVRLRLVGGDVVVARTAEKVAVRPGVLGHAGNTALRAVLTAVIVIAAAVGISIAAPALYYQFFPADVVVVTPQEQGTAFGGDFAQPAVLEPTPEPYVPPIDASLPQGDWLIIPRIGVRTQLQPTENPEEALQTGVWQVPDFGTPGSRDMPMILAAHRYGWQWWWKTDYWKYHSFYLLPDTQPGDRIEIISGQRKWLYEIYAGEEGDEITDYAADLILYTCKFLQSPVRHFRYARLIDPTVDTQVGSL